MMRFANAATVLAIGVLSACAGDNDGIKAFNADPTATITSHATGIEFSEGDSIGFRGAVSDPDDNNSSLLATWYIGEDVACEEVYAEVDGTTNCDITIGLDDTEISLEVKDPYGAAGTARITFTVLPTDAPVAEIVAPTTDSQYYAANPIEFAANLSDTEDENATLTAVWESDLDGVLTPDTTPDTDGRIVGFDELTEGNHAISLTVTDSSGKIGKDSVVVNVGPPNSAPTCSITEPASNTADQEGVLVTFKGLAEDVDIANSDLTVEWSSDKDGVLGASTPNTAGEVTFPYDLLTVNTHVISMTVTDELGEACVADLVYTVGTPPVLAVASPTTGEVFNEGDNITFSATVSDGEDVATDITLEWTSSLDGLFSTQGADSTGNIQFFDSGRSVGDHNLEVRATDTDGLYAVILVPFTVNGLPTAPTLRLDPSTPGSDDELAVTIITPSIDPEGDPITYSYEWFKNSVSSTASTSDKLPSSATLKGETWMVEVTPNDGLGDGAKATASVVIGNTAPTVTSVAISPSTSVTTSTTLTCSAVASDVDGDTLTYDYAWADGAGTALGSGDTLTLSPADVSPTDTVKCTVTVTDTDSATATDSASVTIDNTSPVVTSVVISSGTDYTTDATLTCTAAATDDDGGTPTITFGWTNGSGASLGTGASLTLSPSDVSPGDSVICTATARDVHGGVDSDADTITVVNTDPVVTSALITPSSGVTTSTGLTCSGTATDDDGGSPTLTYAWTDGSGTALGTGSTLTLTPSDIQPTDVVVCEVTATDTDGGTDSATDRITVDNTPPTVDSISISPSGTVTTSTELTCVATASDADLETPAITFEWTDGSGAKVGTAATYTLSPRLFSPGDTIRCTATATDGYSGVDSDNITVTIQNTRPVLASVSLSPTVATESTTLKCAPGTATDDDGDTVTFSYEWEIDGVSVSGATSTTLTGSDFDKSDKVTCLVTPNDGREDGVIVTSNVVTIGNTPPVLASATLSPTTAYENTTLNCAAGTTSDVDSDTVTTSVEWFVNGSRISTTGTKLTGADFGRDDDVYCEVTPNDGTDDGSAVRSSTVRILNTAPTVSTATINPTVAYTNTRLTCTASGLADIDGDTITTEYMWTRNGTNVGTGSSLSGTSFSKGDRIVCKVTPKDGTSSGTEVSSAVLTISNSAPSIASVALGPTAANETSTLKCTPGASTDLDGDSVTMNYTWYVNGGRITATSSTLTGASFSKSDKVECEATPTDGTDSGTPIKSNPVTIGNTVPTVASVTLTPNPAYEQSTLRCTPGPTSDADGDSVTIKTQWLVNASVISVTSATLTGSEFSKGDRVECRVTPFDGTDDGRFVSSASVTIANTGPVATSVRISPDPADQADTLNCNYSYSDADGDAQSGTTIKWTVTTPAGSVSTFNRNTLSSRFGRGDKISCEVTPKDGDTFGTAVVSPILTISNSPPIASAVNIRPNPARRADTLSCGYSYTDADGDTESGTLIEWAVTTPSGSVSRYTRASLSGVFSRDDQVVCTVTPKDGTTAGTPSSSGALKIANTAPVAASVFISPNPGRVSDTLTCNYAYSDADGNAESGTEISWTVVTPSGGSSTYTGSSISGVFKMRDMIKCQVRPRDGSDFGTTVASASLTISNTKPVASRVSISPSPALQGDTLACNYTYTDADGDVEDGTKVEWAVTDASGGVTNYARATLSGVFGRGDSVRCTVTPRDGSEFGAAVASPALFIANSPPTASVRSITPDPARRSDTLRCNYVYNDPDGDAESGTRVQWTVTPPSGSATTYSGTTLSGVFARGDSVQCKVTPRDGSDDGPTQTSSSMVISNSAPSVSGVTVSPNPAKKADTLTCKYTYTDPDSDPERASIVEWTVVPRTGSAVKYTGRTLSGVFAKGDTVKCAVTPYDGTNYGSERASSSVAISNTAPTASAVSISPSPAQTTDRLTCNYTYADADADKENGTTIQWTVTTSSGSSSTYSGTNLSGVFSLGDTITCKVSPKDGTDFGAAVTSPPTSVSNSVPKATGVAIAPNPAKAGNTLNCNYTYSDPDGDPESGTVIQWTVVARGGVTTSYTQKTLSTGFVRGDSVSCKVTPKDGTVFGATVTSSALVISNTAPTATAVNIGPNPARRGDTLKCNYTYADVDLDTEKGTKIEWIVTTPSGSASTYSGATLSGSFNRGDKVTCSVTPNDDTDFGVTVTSPVRVISNTAPTVRNVVIAPNPAKRADTLRCNYFYSDADADKESGTQVTWTVTPTSGSAVNYTSNTLSGKFGKGDRVVCTVRPRDGTDFGASVSSGSITISNTAPTATSVKIQPNPAKVGNKLQCNYTFTDVDGDSESGTTVQWAVTKPSGSVSTYNGDSLSSGFKRGDSVVCSVTPKDGVLSGPRVSSARLVISNTAPTVRSVNIRPNPAKYGDKLSCNYTYDDADGDAESGTTVEWKVTFAGGGSSTYTGSTLSSGFGHKDSVMCTVRPNDGTDFGSSASSPSLVISNTVPVARNVNVSPNPAYKSDTLRCNYTYSDVDGDAEAGSSIQWTVTTPAGGSTVHSTTTLSGKFGRGDKVTCTVTPRDGTLYGSSVSSPPITISNNAPTASSVFISPNPAYATDTLDCKYTYSDADGDPESGTTYLWRVTNRAGSVNTYTTRTIKGVFARGDAITCSVTPKDGRDPGPTVGSTSVTISNTVPMVTGLSVSPNPAYKTDTLRCNYTFNDSDGDANNSTVRWSISGALVGTGATLSGGFKQGDTVVCEVTPYDGVTTGSPMTTSIAIGNRLPTVRSVNITPNPATPSSTLSCNYTFTDADGDSDLSSIAWTKGGTTIGTGSTVSSGFVSGDTVICTVTPKDGYGTGSPVSGSIVIGSSEVDLSKADTKIVGEGASDYAGWSVSRVGDVNVDGYDDFIFGAYSDDDGATNAGATYLVLGRNGTISSGKANVVATIKLTGEKTGDYVGYTVSDAGDVNGDGIPDVLLGVPYWSTEGGAYLLHGGCDGSSTYTAGPCKGVTSASGMFKNVTSGSMSLSLADVRLEGENRDDYAGWSASGAGDVNQDGYSDILVGAWANDGAGSNAGASYLILGGCDGAVACGRVRTGIYAGVTLSSSGPDIFDLGDADVKITGESASDYSGIDVSDAGDINHDGFADILIGSSKEDTAATDAGAVYILLGGCDLNTLYPKTGHPCSSITAGTGLFQHVSSAGLMSLAKSDVKMTGEAKYDLTDVDVERAGDINGDGISDILVGANREDTAGIDAGATYLLSGGCDGVTTYTAGPCRSVSGRTGLFSFISSSSNRMSLGDADVIFTGEGVSNMSGSSVSALSDFNGDGYDDLVVGAYQGSSINSGSVYLIWGGCDGGSYCGSAKTGLYAGLTAAGIFKLAKSDEIFIGEKVSDYAGWSVSGAGDLDGDEFCDLVIGAPYEDSSGSYSGAVYVIYGDGRSASSSTCSVKGGGASSGTSSGGGSSSGGSSGGGSSSGGSSGGGSSEGGTIAK